MRHPSSMVRVGCCKVLDQFMDEAALPELIDNLTHADEEVRAWALHALACDRCKEGMCRPVADDVIPRAAKMLLEDQSRRVRQMAAGLVGEGVLRSAAALPALEQARKTDPHPVVRKIAGWYLPGGPRYKTLATKELKRR
ncbi:MAG: HEAT repeat domain-containing protein [Anaerolineae bacterium]|nr:HEAT repeat domain-containing protein [Anaerolineae bacterium]